MKRVFALGTFAILALAFAGTFGLEPGLTTRVEAGQLVYELACPGGTTPIFAGGFQTYDPQTSQFRSLACVNPSNGQVQILPANLGTGTPAAGKYIDGASGAWTALPAVPETVITGVSIGTAGQTLTSGIAPCSTSVASCTVVTFAQGHTLIRFQYFLQTAPVGCTTAPGIGVRDITAGSNLSNNTIANGATLGEVDSGALSVAMTAGHVFGVGPTQTSGGCSTNANVIDLVAVYQ